jgi:hypothetical protein
MLVWDMDIEQNALDVMIDAREAWVEMAKLDQTEPNMERQRRAKKLYTRAILQLLDVLNTAKP